VKRTPESLSCSIGTLADTGELLLLFSKYSEKNGYAHTGSCTIEPNADGTLSYIIMGTVAPPARLGCKEKWGAILTGKPATKKGRKN
jgi:hypothetical protein